MYSKNRQWDSEKFRISRIKFMPFTPDTVKTLKQVSCACRHVECMRFLLKETARDIETL